VGFAAVQLQYEAGRKIGAAWSLESLIPAPP
jgi:hypothetical protein